MFSSYQAAVVVQSYKNFASVKSLQMYNKHEYHAHAGLL